MRRTILVKILLAVCVVAAAVYGGKLVAEHELSNSNGFYNSDPSGWGWLPDVAIDDGGNVCQFFFTRGADSNITEFAYEARDKKGKIYSQGTLPEAVGLQIVNIPTSVANGRGGFGKKLLLIGYRKGTDIEYALYKLGKNGAEKVGSKTFDLSNPGDFAVAWMHKGKIVTENGKQVMLNDDVNLMPSKTEFNIRMYNQKFKETSKGGTFVADQSLLVGKGVVAIDQGASPNELTARIFKP
jgi:hypothetical protein